MAAEFRGNCCGLTSVEYAVATAVEFRGNCRVLPWHLPWEDCRGNCRGMPWHSPLIAVECRGNWRGDGHGICRGSCRGTSISCHGWYHGGCHGQNRGTCHGHNHGTCRGSTMYNRKPWPLPWKPADIHGSPWQDPRKTTEVPRSLPRTPTKKSNNVHHVACITPSLELLSSLLCGRHGTAAVPQQVCVDHYLRCVR